jgi:DNA mismatch endonuclease (patch repair protein)
MANVRSTDSAPELLVRSMVHRMGYRFRLHCTELPGKPDIVLRRLQKIILVNGCFWHGHEGCPKATLPKTNIEFWTRKVEGNKARDQRVAGALARMGWRVLVVWQCELKKPIRVRAKIKGFLREAP